MSVVWTTLTLLLVAAIAAGWVTLILGHLSAWHHFTREAPCPPAHPPPTVSILKPVEGVQPHSYEAFASFCRQDYPGRTELLIGTITEEDPVVPLVQKLQQAFPDRHIRLLFAPVRGANRKTSIMETLWQEASGEFLLFSDADVTVQPDYLRRVVHEFHAPDVGCVTCLPRGVQARSVSARWIALHYDFNYLPQWMLARWTTGITWAIGHTMAVRRSVLERMDGFLGFLDHLADDYELGHRTAALGLQVRVAPLLLDCVMPQETLGAAYRRLLRWKRTMRRARGAAFVGAGLTYPVFWSAVLALLNPLTAWAWAVLGSTVLLRLLLAALLQRQVRLPEWHRAWWWLPAVDLLEGLTFLGAYTGNTITWAGRRYRLQSDGTLQPWDRPAK